MKTLWIMRHAKARGEAPGEDDHERALEQRGQDEARAVGEHFLALRARPAMIVTSTAKRAVETADIVARILGPTAPSIQKRRELYLASPREILAGLGEAALEIAPGKEEELETALLVGHNPGLEELLQHVTPGRRVRLPTAGLVQVSFDVATFGQVTLATPWRVDWMWRPSDPN